MGNAVTGRLVVLFGALCAVAAVVPAPVFGTEPSCPSGYVALTFDDGPAGSSTARILDILAERRVRATFFVNGIRFAANAGYADLVRRAAADGHVVANHLYSHVSMTHLSDQAIRDQALRNVDAAAAIGVRMAPIVRPPFGAHSARTDHALQELGMTVVMWNIDPEDWRGRGASAVAAHVLARLRDGGNVVMHDRHAGGALPAIIDGMRARGYCPGVLGDDGRVVPPGPPIPPDPGPECARANGCDSLGFVDGGGQWHFLDAVSSGAAEQVIWFGDPGDVPMMGDWDCDGVDTPALYRASTGYAYLRNSNTSGTAERQFYFGDPGDVPLAGDWDGDGCDTLAVYRPGEARMYLSNRLGRGSAEVVYAFGNPGDAPVVGDFNGDGRDDLALQRVTTGLVYARFSHTPGVADLRFVFGDPGDRLVAGDWDGDGVDTLAAYRPRTRMWYVKLSNQAGAAEHVLAGPNQAHPTPIAGTFGFG